MNLKFHSKQARSTFSAALECPSGESIEVRRQAHEKWFKWLLTEKGGLPLPPDAEMQFIRTAPEDAWSYSGPKYDWTTGWFLVQFGVASFFWDSPTLRVLPSLLLLIVFAAMVGATAWAQYYSREGVPVEDMLEDLDGAAGMVAGFHLAEDVSRLCVWGLIGTTVALLVAMFIHS